MKRFQSCLIFIIYILMFSSCATLLNSKTTNIHIVIKEPSYSIVEKDTVKLLSTDRYIVVERDKKPIDVTIFNDSLKKSFQIKSKNSFNYWLNLYPSVHLWTGFLIDRKNPKRYTYPKVVYVDLKDTTMQYQSYVPLDNPYSNNLNVLKVTPFKIIGMINPAVEISYERVTGNNFSTQLMASYLLPYSLLDGKDVFSPGIKGFRGSLEERYYFRKSAPVGPYVGFEVNYLKNKYREIARFGEPRINPDSTYYRDLYEDSFGIRKQTISGNFMIGYQKIHNRFVIDVYAGLGLKYKNTVHFGRIRPEDEMEMPRHPNIHYFSNEEGKFWTVSIPLNVKIGWIF